MISHIETENTVVEVFKTNISDAQQSIVLKEKLLLIFPRAKINFDLEDCDKILRIESTHIDASKVLEMGTEINIHIEVLND